jgi:hypothetical protein
MAVREKNRTAAGSDLGAPAPPKNVSHCSTELTTDCNHEQLGVAAETKDRVQTERWAVEEHEGTTQ